MRQILITALLLITGCGVGAGPSDQVIVTVKRNYSPIPKDNDGVVIAISWKDLVAHLPQLKNAPPVVTDRNFGKQVSARTVDTNNDKIVDYLLFDYAFQSNEPIFSFLITTGKGMGKRIHSHKRALARARSVLSTRRARSLERMLHPRRALEIGGDPVLYRALPIS